MDLAEIKRLDSPALTHVIEYWKDHDRETVLMAYAELRKRDYPIKNKIEFKFTEFANGEDVEKLLHEITTKYDFDTPEEEPVVYVKSKYETLSGLSDILNAAGWFFLVAALIAAAFMIKDENWILSVISIVSGILILLAFLTTAKVILLLIDIAENTSKNQV